VDYGQEMRGQNPNARPVAKNATGSVVDSDLRERLLLSSSKDLLWVAVTPDSNSWHGFSTQRL
jgi:hypothetical protein